MKFGMIAVNMDVRSGDEMIQLAQKAEEVGFESVWTFEHTIIPMDYESKYPYSEDGKMGGTPEVNMVDPMVSLAAVAGATTKLRLATGVNILPQANPIYMAKQAASLDFVSNGRFMLGVGVGWLREEYEAIGVPFERRGARFDDYVAAMRKMWSGEVVEHESEFISWSGFKSYPLPVQKPGIPLIIGGDSARAFARTAKIGDGWFAAAGNPDTLAPWVEQLHKACDAHDRDPSTVEITSMWFPTMTGPDAIKQFEDLGVERLVVYTLALGGKPLEAIERFANETIARA